MATPINYSYPSDSYSYSGISNPGSLSSGAIVGIFTSFSAIFLLIFFIMIVSNWKIFTKAGKPGWASLVPIYNLVVMLRIACMPEWMVILFFIPLVNAFIGLIMQAKIVKAFGKSTGFIIGYFLLPLIFLPILAFDNSEYTNSPTDPNNSQTPTPAQSPVENPTTVIPQTQILTPPTNTNPIQPPKTYQPPQSTTQTTSTPSEPIV